MIKLQRPACPNPEKLKTDYAFPENKKALVESTHGKCMYCESKITSTDYGDIEHIKPKSKHPELKFIWENLGYSCTICNQKYKKDCDNEKLINPYIDDPSEFLDIEGPVIIPKDNCEKGKFTITNLGLNRFDLVEKRVREVLNIDRLTQQIKETTDPDTKKALILQVNEYISSEEEFSFVKKECFKDECIKLNINI